MSEKVKSEILQPVYADERWPPGRQKVVKTNQNENKNRMNIGQDINKNGSSYRDGSFFCQITIDCDVIRAG